MSASARHDHPFDEILIDVPNFRPDEIVGIETEIDHDGRNATFHIQFNGRGPVKIDVSDLQMGMVMGEFQRAHCVMNSRQLARRLDRGVASLLEIADAAATPAWQRVILDHKSGDMLLLLQFDTLPPTSLRLSQDFLQELDIRRDMAKGGTH